MLSPGDPVYILAPDRLPELAEFRGHHDRFPQLGWVVTQDDGLTVVHTMHLVPVMQVLDWCATQLEWWTREDDDDVT